ncbi:hypothetical protein KC19_5G127200 [Ceratodon purpureus]|uniref:C2 domain-containing protein n=1 Tax=Ceratodon purpureus TaxID=3225 RepID=A0A8T0I1N7_CERPU|nr:hypothetical protein KC19_5G127200 [Ceratodon purpureus]
MAFVRHLKVTLRRARNVNACTFGKSRTVVTAKATYKNLVYTTSKVEDLGQNPVWEKDGTNVFHFDFKDESEFVTLELFNRNNASIGVSKLLFSELGHLLQGRSETKTLQVMVTPQRQFGELFLETEILEHQAMGDRGLLTVEIRKGLIQRITSILGSKTTKIKANVTYKHTTYSSGVLENMGNKFIWHEDNVFTFIINSDVKEDDKLKLEVYNVHTKVGECEMLMSLFLEQEENLRGVPNEFVAHSTDLCLPKRSAAVGNIEVAASFTRKPACRRSSFPPPQHYPPYSQPPPPFVSNTPYPAGYFPPGPQAPLFNPSASFNARSSAQPPELYSPVAGFQRPSTRPPELYPPAAIQNMYNVRTTTHVHQTVGDQTYAPSAPVYNEEVVMNHHPPGLTPVYQEAHGAPAGSRGMTQYPELDDEMRKFMDCFH